MVIARPINLNVSYKLHPYSLQKTRSSPEPCIPKSIRNTAICGCWFGLQWWKWWYTLLMRTNKVKKSCPVFLYVMCKSVAERNLNFCLAHNLIWLLESPNIFTQSGWLVLFSPNHISKQHQKLKKAHESLSRSEILNGNGRLNVCFWIAAAPSYTMRRDI